MENLNEKLLKECGEKLFPLGSVFTPVNQLEEESYNDFIAGEIYVLSSVWVKLDSNEGVVADYSFECLSNRYRDYNLNQYQLELNISKGNLKQLPAETVKRLEVKYFDTDNKSEYTEVIYVDSKFDLSAENASEYIRSRVCDRYHSIENNTSSWDRDNFDILAVTEIK